MRKSRSILDDLPANQVGCLCRWLIDDKPALTYREARERMKLDFNVATSESALCEWRARKIQERQLEKILASAAKAKEVKDKVRLAESEIFEALME